MPVFERTGLASDKGSSNGMVRKVIMCGVLSRRTRATSPVPAVLATRLPPGSRSITVFYSSGRADHQNRSKIITQVHRVTSSLSPNDARRQATRLCSCEPSQPAGGAARTAVVAHTPVVAGAAHATTGSVKTTSPARWDWPRR
jgi:hypothetical protein